ncbi:MAG: hypothetical protein PHS04_15730 [Tissierellia bacterium]|nr:hypothetical protein [Tissierellia bacterium]
MAIINIKGRGSLLETFRFRRTLPECENTVTESMQTLEENNEWKIILCHWSLTKPSIG